jgi:Ca2+/Na+ antiporter
MKALFEIFMQNQEVIVTAVIIMISTVIVLMGILKRLVFNRIKSKALRCVALSFTSLALVYAATAIYFAINGVDFRWFLPCGTLICFAMIVTYWFYENTQARAGIHKIGSFVISTLFAKILAKVKGVADSTEKIGGAIDDFLKSTEKKNEIKKDDLTKL